MTAAKQGAPDPLATAIADGDVVDWAHLMAAAHTPADRVRVGKFALLARIAAVHAVPAEAEDAPRTASQRGHIAPLPDLPPGTFWGSLRIVERLGAGTFGVVYRAHDSRLARDVALKILNQPSGSSLNTEVVAEGRLLARVRHPHVVAIYGADWHDNLAGIWMELIEGQTLEEELHARGPLPTSEVITIGMHLASAVQAVHAAGLLHRDLKTQNVMRDRDGRVVLMDFSAGRDQSDDAGRSGWLPASIAGSPLYLAPECFDGAAASVRSDIYSLGVVLHRLAAASYPVEAATLDALARQHRTGGGMDLPQLSAAAPALVDSVSRMLSRDPLQRPASGSDAMRLLHGVLKREPSLYRRRLIAPALLTVLVSAGLALSSRPMSRVPGAGTPVATTTRRMPVTTTSLQARAGYQEGLAALMVGERTSLAQARATFDRAQDRLRTATEIDPSFASAWILRARTAASSGAPSADVLAMAEQALTLSAHVSDPERAYIDAVTHRLRADITPDRRDELQSAAKSYERVLAYTSDHYWSLVELHGVYDRLQRAEDADRIGLLAVRFHPRSLRAAIMGARAHLRSGDEESLRLVVDEALAAVTPDMLEPGIAASRIAWLTVSEVRAAWLQGDAARTLRALEHVSVQALPGHSPREHMVPLSDVSLGYMLSQSAMSIGRYEDARTAMRRIAGPSRRHGLALIDARQERWTSLREVLAPGGHLVPAHQRQYHFLYLMGGLLDGAEAQVATLRQSRTGEAWQVAQEFEAQLRVKQERHAEALVLFAPLLADERGPRLYMHEQVAIARRGVGDLTGAISMLERFERDPVLVHVDGFAGHDWLRCILRLAEFYQEQGRTADAARAAGKVRAMLQVADAEHPFRDRLAALPWASTRAPTR